MANLNDRNYQLQRAQALRNRAAELKALGTEEADEHAFQCELEADETSALPLSCRCFHATL